MVHPPTVEVESPTQPAIAFDADVQLSQLPLDATELAAPVKANLEKVQDCV